MTLSMFALAACSLLPGKKSANAPASSSDGVPHVGALEAGKPPPWCSGYEVSSGDSNLHWVQEMKDKEGWSGETLAYMAKAACDKPDDDARQKLVTGWAAAFKAERGGSDQDFVEAMTLGVKDSSAIHKLRDEQCASYTTKNSEMPKEELALRGAIAATLGCEENLPDDVLWWLDRPQVNGVQRTALVNACLHGRDVANDDAVAGEFAFCLTDFKRLDRSEFDKALAALKPNLYGKVQAVTSFLDAKRNANVLLKKYAELEKDAGWKKLLAASEAGYQKWMKEYDANKATFDAIRAFNDKIAKGSKSAVAGCGNELRKLFFAHMQTKKSFKSVEEVQALATDIVGYPLLVAMMRCDAAEGHYLPVVAAEDLFIEHAKQHNGPRLEGFEETVAALNDVRGDRDKFPLEPESIYPRPPATGYKLWNDAYSQTFNKVHYSKGANAQIKTIQKKGDVAQVTFKTVKWREETSYDCHDTRKIYRIAEDGHLEYEQSCKHKMENMTSTEAPVEVPADFAAGLKPGQMVALMIDDADKKRVGVPVGVWTGPDKKKLIGTFGLTWP